MVIDLVEAAVTSVVVAAHNEAAVLDRSLPMLIGPGVQVIVAANGCTDNTVEVARRHPVEVLDLATPSKVVALNAGDRVARGFPRMYVDADVVLSPGAISHLTRALNRPGALAAVPLRRLELSGRPLLVRAYFAIHSRLPVFYNGLFGRGVVALSEAGRARFGEFPTVVADDLFLDSLFGPNERTIVPEASVLVETPRKTRDLVRRLVRVRSGNSALRQAAAAAGAPAAVRASDKWSWLRDVVLPAPWLAPAAVCYVGITVTAGVLAKRARRRGTTTWQRDESSRVTTS